jgi:hypothetical protein
MGSFSRPSPLTSRTCAQETEAAEKRERFRRSRREAYKQKLRRGGMKVQEYRRREL